jgi:hypothetical protein
MLEDRNKRNVPQYAPVRKESTVLLHISDSATESDRIFIVHIAGSNSHFAAVRLDEAVEAP